MRSRTRIVVVTGTDTGVGKTHVAALIARQTRRGGVAVGAYKPAVSGCDASPAGIPVWEDVERLREAIGGGVDDERICPQRFRAPLAPPVAARLEHTAVDESLLRDGLRWWLGRVDLLLVEGAGGLLAPLSDQTTIADLAAEFSVPLLIVARLGLGTINHTLLTVEAAQRRGLRTAGIVLNQTVAGPVGLAEETNPRELADRCPVPVLGIVPHGERETLRTPVDAVRMDWLALAEGIDAPR